MDTSTVNLLSLIGGDTQLKKVANTRGGEWHGACPVCGGTDRFLVQPHYKNGFFMCRQCGRSGDAIEYVKWTRTNGDFKAAVAWLNLPLEQRSIGRMAQPPRPAVNSLNDYACLINVEYQNAAYAFYTWAVDTLHSEVGAKALAYLQGRGISPDVLRDKRIGFNPEDIRLTWGGVDVFIPRGITIPWIHEGSLWRLNVRRAVGTPKYQQIKGGANGLYNAASVGVNDVAVMVEGEFDALVLMTHVKGITPVATGTTTWARVSRWTSLLSIAQLVLLAFDVDENGAGDDAAAWWKKALGDRAQRYAPPAHDITDAWKAGIDLQNWLEPNTLYAPLRESTARALGHRTVIQAGFKDAGYRMVYP